MLNKRRRGCGGFQPLSSRRARTEVGRLDRAQGGSVLPQELARKDTLFWALAAIAARQLRLLDRGIRCHWGEKCSGIDLVFFYRRCSVWRR